MNSNAHLDLRAKQTKADAITNCESRACPILSLAALLCVLLVASIYCQECPVTQLWSVATIQRVVTMMATAAYLGGFRKIKINRRD